MLSWLCWRCAPVCSSELILSLCFTNCCKQCWIYFGPFQINWPKTGKTSPSDFLWLQLSRGCLKRPSGHPINTSWEKPDSPSSEAETFLLGQVPVELAKWIVSSHHTHFFPYVKFITCKWTYSEPQQCFIETECSIHYWSWHTRGSGVWGAVFSCSQVRVTGVLFFIVLLVWALPLFHI